MFKHIALSTTLFAMLVLGASGTSPSTGGSWRVDTRHSDAKLVTDATTNYGKSKLNVALGYGRIYGKVKIDDADLAKSSVEFRFYPATTMDPPIAEDGKFLSHWLENLSNTTLVCFHSRRIERLPDGRLQVTGELAVTRVDRNVEAASSEAYAGPVYGPPITHRVAHSATFTFSFPAADGGPSKENSIQATGSTSVFREDFPQLVRTVVSTYWPPLIQDEQCQVPDASEAYSGAQCTGTYLSTAGLPPAPSAANGEDVGVDQGFNSVVGDRLAISLHLRLMANSANDAGKGAE